MTKTSNQEDFSINGQEAYDAGKKIVHEGAVRQIVIKNVRGERVVVLPLLVAVIGTILVPYVALVAFVIALALKCTIVLERSTRE